MEPKDYIVKLYDGTKVFVTPAVYHAYYRMKWQEEWNTRTYYKRNQSLNASHLSSTGKQYTLMDRLSSNEVSPEEYCLSKTLLDSLQILSLNERQIISSIYLKGMTITSCAISMGKSIKYIRYHRDAALKKLKKHLT